jgi:hypothetical protein
MHRRQPRGRAGVSFTLLELLVVIAIITVLVALLTPALQRVSDIKKMVVCMSNLRQVGVASHSYAHDSDGRLVYAGFWNDAPDYGAQCMYVMYQYQGYVYDSHKDEAVNLGLVLEGGYFHGLGYKNDAVLRCPTTTPDMCTSDSKGKTTHTNYMYSSRLGHWVNARAAFIRQPFPELGDERYQGPFLESIKPQRALYADIFTVPPTPSPVLTYHWPHSISRPVSTVYADGSVSFVKDMSPPLLLNMSRMTYYTGKTSGAYPVWYYLENYRQ